MNPDPEMIRILFSCRIRILIRVLQLPSIVRYLAKCTKTGIKIALYRTIFRKKYENGC